MHSNGVAEVTGPLPTSVRARGVRGDGHCEVVMWVGLAGLPCDYPPAIALRHLSLLERGCTCPPSFPTGDARCVRALALDVANRAVHPL
jgi:hypothetical protein